MNLFRNMKLFYKIFSLIVLALVMLITVGISWIQLYEPDGEKLGDRV